MRRPTKQAIRRPGLLAILAFVAFIVLWAAYRAGSMHEIDREVVARLREVRSTWLDALSALDDALFRPTPTFAAAIVLAVALLRFGPAWSWCAPPLIGLTAMAEVAVKTGVGQLLHPRVLIDGVLVLFGGVYHAPGSFPSGHVARAMFLAVTVAAFAPRRVSVPFAILALTAPFARMYSETHHLSDVLAGAVLGTCVASAGVWAVGAASDVFGQERRNWPTSWAAVTRRYRRRREGPPPDDS